MTDIQIFYDGPIVKRADAVRLGLPRYFTGKPCKNGHINQRVTKKCDCVSCVSEMNRRQLGKGNNREKAMQRSRDYYSKSDKKEWYEKNIEWMIDNYGTTSAYWRHHYSKSREYRAENKKIHYNDNKPDYIARSRSRRAKVKGAKGSHTADDVNYIMWSQLYMCIYCGDPIRDDYHVDHVMPIALGGGNGPDNLQCLCPTCNLRKGALHPDDWASRFYATTTSTPFVIQST